MPTDDEQARLRSVGLQNAQSILRARRRAEEALRQSEHFLKRVTDVVPGVIQVFDLADKRTVYMNRSVATLLGYSADELRALGGEVLPSLMHADDLPRFAQHMTRLQALGDQEIADFEHRLRDRSGDWRWFHSRDAVFARDADGRARQIIGAAVEITERKRAEDELREAERKKDNFIATLAHELRNPLAPIRNALHVMRQQLPADPQLAWCGDVIDRQVGQMARLLEDLLDVSRITQGKFGLRREPVALAAVVEQAVEIASPFIDVASHALAVTLPPQPLTVDGDPTRLAQIFGNLLINAAKYTQDNGRIVLTAQLEADEVVVRVKDSGIGIGAEHLRHIFEMFSQVQSALVRAQGGLGIGLALVKGLVEMHGGQVSAVSDGLGRGSEFIVRLPIAHKSRHAEFSEDPVATHSSVEHRCRILVADDSRDTVESLAMLLRMSGHDVHVADDGEQALQMAEGCRPQVALLDIGMPKLNGYEVCRRIREQPWGRGMTLVAQTGWGQESDRRHTREAGFDHHLVKPVDVAALEDILRAVVTRAMSSP